MNLNWTIIGLSALIIALVILWRHKGEAGRVTVLMMLLGGTGLTLSVGAVSDWLHRIGTALVSAAESATSVAVGVGLPALVVVGLATWVVLDLRDKSIHPATPWVALGLPTLVVVLGGAAAAADLLGAATGAGA